MTAIERVIAAARAEVGYLEKASNAQLYDKTANAGHNNYTKYGAELDSIGGIYNGTKNGCFWCDVFVDWLFISTFGKETGMKMLYQPSGGLGASCTYSAQYFKQSGAWYSSPKVGDQIFFTYSNDGYDHTGIVVKIDGGRVYTIEGNTSGEEGVVDNGGGVFEKSYALGYSQIGGYGRPNYSLIKEEKEVTYEEWKAFQQKYEAEQAAKGVSAWAWPAVKYCKAHGIMTGDTNGSFYPQKNITRQEAAQMMYGLSVRYKTLDDVPSWGRETVEEMLDRGVLAGCGEDESGATLLNLSETELRTLCWISRAGE